jgi:drug/metabolite transporter (DMT)-like permease
MEKTLMETSSKTPSRSPSYMVTSASTERKFKFILAVQRNFKIIIFNIIIGQILALLIVANGKTSEILQKDEKFATPLFMTSLYYFFLFWLWFLINRKIKKPRLVFLFIAVCDSQSNFLMVFAFSKIPPYFIFVINVLSVFWTVILSIFFVKEYKYTKIHIIGVIIAIIGVCLTFYGCIAQLEDKNVLFDNMEGLAYCIIASLGYSM